jgi:hypothetical protein
VNGSAKIAVTAQLEIAARKIERVPDASAGTS